MSNDECRDTFDNLVGINEGLLAEARAGHEALVLIVVVLVTEPHDPIRKLVIADIEWGDGDCIERMRETAESLRRVGLKAGESVELRRVGIDALDLANNWGDLLSDDTVN